MASTVCCSLSQIAFGGETFYHKRPLLTTARTQYMMGLFGSMIAYSSATTPYVSVSGVCVYEAERFNGQKMQLSGALHRRQRNAIFYCCCRSLVAGNSRIECAAAA